MDIGSSNSEKKSPAKQPESLLEDSQAISLLWPKGSEYESLEQGHRLSESSVIDLDLEFTIKNICLNTRYHKFIESILLYLCEDLEVIRFRQNVFDDLLRFPDLSAELEDILPKISSLNRYHLPREKGGLLFEVTWRLGELETYVECVQELGVILGQTGERLSSDGLRQLRDSITGIKHTRTFQNLVKELPGLLSKVRNIASVTIGVNLDQDLQPVEATLVSVNKEKFTGSSSSLFRMLFGRNTRKNEWHGIAQLHRVPSEGRASRRESGNEFFPVNPIMVPLFRDLSNVLTKICRPIAAALQRYIGVNSRFLANISTELAFYLGAVKLIKRIQASGLPMCRPELASKEERICELKDSYNVNLALRLGEREGKSDLSRTVVTNDAVFGPKGCIFILTGPNQGGKTTYMQSIGLMQVLAQAGLYVPGKQARLSPVEGIHTHFPAEERLEMDTGRLGEEAKRLSDIFSYATRYSLLLLNESLSNTSPRESLYLARDITRILRLLGARAIYTTHLHELASEVEELNAEPQVDSKIVSMVSLIKEETGKDGSTEGTIIRTFKIVPGPPAGRSYAREIASRYGISYDQLVQKLRGRGLVK